MHSSTSSANIVDLLTGTPLPPQNEPKYTYNAALWYDDGRLSARIALQAVGSYFNCIAACGKTTSMFNYPNVGALTAYLTDRLQPAEPPAEAAPASREAAAPAVAAEGKEPEAAHDELSDEELTAMLFAKLEQLS